MEAKNLGEENPKEETESKVLFKIPGPPRKLKHGRASKAAEDNRLDSCSKIPVASPEEHADAPYTKRYSSAKDRCPFAETELSLEEFKVPVHPLAASSLLENPVNKPKVSMPVHNNNNQTSSEVCNHPLAASSQPQNPENNQEVPVPAHNNNNQTTSEVCGLTLAASSLPPNPANNQEVMVYAHNNDNNNQQTTSVHFPVTYSQQNGGVAVISDVSVPHPDGTRAIQTSQYQVPPPSRYEANRPLTKRYQRILKILSVVAAVVFFPTGIPAAYYAFKTEKEFNAGILRGDISLAQKYGKRAEKLIIFSYLLSVMVIILSFTVHERSKWNNSEWAGHRIMPG